MTKNVIWMVLFLCLPLVTAQVTVTLPNQTVLDGAAFAYPINISNVAGQAVNEIDVTIIYRPSVVQIDELSLDGSILSGTNTVVESATLGLLRVQKPTGQVLSEDGLLVTVRGRAQGEGSAWTAVNVAINEGDTPLTLVQGALTVGTLAPVAITSQPEPRILCEGGTLVLQVAATGGEPLRYQWRRDGIELPGQTSVRLTLAGVRSQEGGRYDCLVSNPVSQAASTSAMVSVSGLPRLSTIPETPVACSNQDVVLHYELTGQGLRYQWFKDGFELPGSVSEFLTIEQFEEEDEGEYHCRVANSCGQIETPVMLLSLEQSISIIDQPRSIMARMGDQVTFSIEADGGQPFNYQWFHHDEPLPFATGTELVIDRVTYEDLGAYRCRVDNGCGSMMSEPVDLRQVHDELVLVEDRTGNYFGQQVLLHENQAFVADPRNAGFVSVYARSGDSWRLQQTLTPSQGAGNDQFGSALAADGEWLMVGAPGATKVYFFRRQNHGWQETFVAQRSVESFGTSVALSDGLAAVGAPEKDNRGEVYCYFFEGGQWRYRTSVDGGVASNQKFGASLAVAGNEVFVGLPNSESNRGAVTLYRWVSNRLSIVQTWQAPDPDTYDFFGQSLAVDADTLVVGAPGRGAGAGYIFQRQNGLWVYREVLVAPPHNQYNPGYGQAVAIDQEFIVLGGPSGGGNASDAVVFMRRGASWQLLPGLVGARRTLMGRSVSVRDGIVLVGASSSAYFYQIDPLVNGPCPMPFISTQPRSLVRQAGEVARFEIAVDSDVGVSYQWFHNGQAIPNATSPVFERESVTAAQQGVYHCEVVSVCDRARSVNATLWLGTATAMVPFDIPELEAGDKLGYVSASGNRVAFCAPGDDDAGGAVYVFHWDGSNWNREAKILGHRGVFSGKIQLDADQLAVKDGEGLAIYRFRGGTWVLDEALSLSFAAFAIRGHELFLSVKQGSRNGVIHYYRRIQEGWRYQYQLTHSRDANYSSNNAQPLLLSGDALFFRRTLSTNSYEVAVFRKRKNYWQAETPLEVPDFIVAPSFGSAFVSNGESLLIGSPGDDQFGTDSGAIYWLTHDDFNWRFQHKFNLSVPEPGLAIGGYLAMDGDTLVVGVPADDEAGQNAGAAYVFERDGDQWRQRTKLMDPDARRERRMGLEVVVQGGAVWLGNPLVDDVGVDSGRMLWLPMDGPTQTCLAGDVTGNGIVNHFDAAQVLIHAAQGETDFDPIPLCAGDVSCNGEISAYDSSQILRFDAGLIDQLDCISVRAPLQAALATDDYFGAVAPFQLDLALQAPGALSFQLQTAFSATTLRDLGLHADLPPDWHLRVVPKRGGAILAAAGVAPLGTQPVHLRLPFFPMQAASTEVVATLVSVNEQMVDTAPVRIQVVLQPCRSGDFGAVLAAWPQSDVLEVTARLQCESDTGR